jgi:hypothetical protein
MFDIFEQPWTMLGVAIISMIILFIIRSVYPNKRRWHQLLIPIFIAAFGFGIEYFVKTDLEQINSLIQTGISAIDSRNVQSARNLLSEEYRDSAGHSKEELLAYCDALLKQNLIKSCKQSGVPDIKIQSKTNATVEFNTIIVLEKSGNAELESVPFLKVKVKLDIGKESDKKWRVSKSELEELNNQAVKWSDIR